MGDLKKKVNKKITKTKKVLKGGGLCSYDNDITNPSYNKGGTDGNLSTTFNDIMGVVKYSVGTMTSAGCLVSDLVNIKGDLGKAFTEVNTSSSAPQSGNVSV
jgi:hypothetical protein